jgi:hypothetical protein
MFLLSTPASAPALSSERSVRTASQWPTLCIGNTSSTSYGSFFGYNTQWRDLTLGIGAFSMNRAWAERDRCYYGRRASSFLGVTVRDGN